MAKTIDDITEVKTGHLKDYQKAEILSLQLKYTLTNAMENVAEHFRPVMEQVAKSLSQFFDSINVVIQENSKDGKPTK